MSGLENIPVDRVEIGQRHRRDLGDIAGLAASIADVGLLQPIVVTTQRRLVAGERRLAAARSLNMAEIRAYHVDDLDDAAALLRAERDENTCRKAFTPTEEHALYEALLELEKPKARQRQGTRTDTSQKLSGRTGEARQLAAEAATGAAGRHKTLDKVGEVKTLAADDSTPDAVRTTAREALADMDATGRVDGAYKRVKQAEQAAQTPTPDSASHEPEDDQQLQDIRYVKSFLATLAKADDLLQFDARRLASLLEPGEAETIDRYAASVTRFAEKLRAHRKGFRVVQGGRP